MRTSPVATSPAVRLGDARGAAQDVVVGDDRPGVPFALHSGLGALGQDDYRVHMLA